MKGKRLKNWVLPTLYGVIIVTSFFSISILNNILVKDMTNYDFSKSIMKDVTQEVLGEVEKQEYVKPYLSDSVKIKTSYYNKDDENQKQQESLITYQNTYMPSSGVLYVSESDFEVLSVYDGTITKVSEDEILGNYVEITHNNNLTTYYYSLKDIVVTEGEAVKSGTILGQSMTNKINENESSLYFEVYYQGKSLNPETFYTTNPNDLQ